MTTKNAKDEVQDKSVETDQYEYTTEPPDGGFGWVIAIAAMVKMNKFDFFFFRIYLLSILDV